MAISALPLLSRDRAFVAVELARLLEGTALHHHLLPLAPDAALGHLVREVAEDDAIFAALSMKPARQQLPRLQFDRASGLHPLENLRVIGAAKAGGAEEGLVRAQPDAIDFRRQPFKQGRIEANLGTIGADRL